MKIKKVFDRSKCNGCRHLKLAPVTRCRLKLEIKVKNANTADYLATPRYRRACKKARQDFEERRIQQKQDRHIGCWSYPECDSIPIGCVVRYGDKAEHVGWRD